VFTYRPHTLPQQFIIVGGGGTGGRLVPLLAQFIRSITKDVGARGWLVDPTIIIIDDDVVETKNLIRQNFIQRDVGKPKAVVLAERYSKAFGVNIHPIVQRIDSNTELNKVFMEKVPGKDFIAAKDAIIFMCVDSVKARREVLLAFTRFNIQMTTKPYFVIDAGNEDTFGQVKFFHLRSIASGFKQATSSVTAMKAPVMVPERVALPFIPLDVAYYDSIVDNQAASCADLDQTLSINAQMATMMMGVAQNYMYFKPFTYSGRNFDLAGAGNTTWMTMDAIRRMTWFMKEEVPANSFMAQFPKTQSSPAKVILDDYIKKNRDKLTSMGLDPDTGKKFEVFKEVSIIEDPKPVAAKEAEDALDDVTVAPVLVDPVAAISIPAPERAVDQLATLLRDAGARLVPMEPVVNPEPPAYVVEAGPPAYVVEAGPIITVAGIQPVVPAPTAVSTPIPRLVGVNTAAWPFPTGARTEEADAERAIPNPVALGALERHPASETELVQQLETEVLRLAEGTPVPRGV
jgi:molybdopterin/thiamine biosynthesis adenylyltransferase